MITHDTSTIRHHIIFYKTEDDTIIIIVIVGFSRFMIRL